MNTTWSLSMCEMLNISPAPVDAIWALMGAGSMEPPAQLSCKPTTSADKM